MNKLCRLIAVALASVCFLPCRGLSDPASVEPLPTLDQLEAGLPKQRTMVDDQSPLFRDVVRVIEANRLSSGHEFLQASNLLSSVMQNYRVCRMQYELLLAATAKGEDEAASGLPNAWDFLLRSVGRPLRFDFMQFVASNQGDESFSLDAAPNCIRLVWQSPKAARETAAKTGDNTELLKLMEDDQASRKGPNIDWQTMAKADREHQHRVREIIQASGLHTAKDFANASMVMQHSSAFVGYQLAHELAVCSLILGDHGMGRWLVAASYDRMLNAIGLVQRFGTQGRPMIGAAMQGKPTVADTDEAGICDAERLALGCPTLAAKRADFYTRPPKE